MSRTEQMISIQKKMEFKIKVSLRPSMCPQPSWAGQGHLSLVGFCDRPPRISVQWHFR